MIKKTNEIFVQFNATIVTSTLKKDGTGIFLN